MLGAAIVPHREGIRLPAQAETVFGAGNPLIKIFEHGQAFRACQTFETERMNAIDKNRITAGFIVAANNRVDRKLITFVAIPALHRLIYVFVARHHAGGINRAQRGQGSFQTRR